MELRKSFSVQIWETVLRLVKAGSTKFLTLTVYLYTSDHILGIVRSELMKRSSNVVLYMGYLLNRFGGHVTFGGGATVR